MFVERQQFVLIGRKLEEPAFLHRPFHRRALRRQLGAILAGDEFALVVIGLVTDRVPTFVTAQIQIAIGRHALPQRLHQRLVIFIGGADEAIIADAQRIIERLEGRHHFIDIGLWGLAGSAGGLVDLQAMLVGAGEESHVEAI